MSRKKPRRTSRRRFAPSRRARVAIAVVLVTSVFAAWTMLAYSGAPPSAFRHNYIKAITMAPPSLNPGSPSKEYIYAGSRLLATEEPTDTSASILPGKLGAFFTDNWRLDHNGNNVWDGPPTDKLYQPFGLPGDVAVAGDWTGSGTSKIGVFRVESGLGYWYLDLNGNGIWNGDGIDKVIQFGLPGDKPAVGDWNGSGTFKIGVLRVEGSVTRWYLDLNGNFIWEGDGIDKVVLLGLQGDLPVAGDWNGSGASKIGVFRVEGSVARWYLDLNGNFIWEGDGIDKIVLFGLQGDLPVAGDWNGSGASKIGVFRIESGVARWYLDFNGNDLWEGDGDGIDRIFSFGQNGDQPVVGNW